MRAGRERRWWSCGRNGRPGIRASRMACGVSRVLDEPFDYELSVTFEVLDFAFVLFGFFQGVEGSEIASFAGGGALLARIEAVFSGF